MTHPATHLRAAVTYLDEHGWVQGMYKRSDGAVCLAAALSASGHTSGAWLALHSFIGTNAVQHWNDTFGRTVDEVKAALLGAADAFEREHPEWPR